MVTVHLRFPAGRYHATPWEHHVNEGLVEWPPSPWRLLRALVAVWHRKCPELPQSTVEALLERLSTELPRFYVPACSVSHTRHYMPIGSLDGAYEKTSKVLDTFVQVSKAEPLKMVWPGMELEDELRDALRAMLSRMTYLGRAESWVEAFLVDAPEQEPLDGARWAYPLDSQDSPGEWEQVVKLLAPLAPAALNRWRPRAFEELLEQSLAQKRQVAQAKGKDESKVKLSAKEKSALDDVLPKSVFEALHADTGELQKQGWSSVPGTSWAQYRAPQSTAMPSRRPRAGGSKEPTVARFAVASAVPPRLTSALHFAEKMRAGLMSRSDGHRAFSGKNPDGTPLEGNRHTFILPEAHGKHGRISHVTLFAPMGYDASARAALEDIRKLWAKGGHDVQLVLLGLGHPADFAGMKPEAGQCPLVAESTTWISMTPFVPTRHPKFTRSGKPKVDAAGVHIGSPEHDLLRLLAEHGLPAPTSLQRVPFTTLSGKHTPWSAFRTIRSKGGGARSQGGGHGFRIEFAQPVRGPIALGYGSHFGLGVFSPPVGEQE